MEAAVQARDAGRQAVRDVAPDALRERILALLEESAMVPGLLALTSARAVERGDGTGGGVGDGTESGATTPTDSLDASGSTVGVEERAAGVQLIYEGLRLTRALADDPPWERDPPHTDSNVDVLAAERPDGLDRDETDGQQGRATPEHALEGDVFELAVLAGTTAFGAEPAEALLSYAADLAVSIDGDQPEPSEQVPDEVEQAMADAPDPRRVSSADDPQPSATDP
jgi:hypothetical protein